MKTSMWIRQAMVAVVAALAAPLAAQAPASGGPPPVFNRPPVDQAKSTTLLVPTLSAAGAQRMVDAVTAEAERTRNAVTIAVVDRGANLIALKRMDGADLGSLQAALAKASSAAKMQIPTGTFLESGTPNLPLATAFISAGLTLLAGGEPIFVKGAFVGAIAVSGTGDDQTYIKIALAALDR
ncbi:heme-binding protein [Novosphingobium piscinae]|uniref:Heme-binding protein n=1 Tax=Novosphingobium piscinae TaxID=1507448 RepID=A0A7X1G1E1_9SPHN|nr:heme-binding protein [Novosphingobium piscinae]MBC2670217.1 heme-binding protein [Novosphingobium piscinae]